MKKILSLLLCAVLVFTMVTPALAADGDNVLYNLSTASELMKYQFVRATLAEVKGYAGKADTRLCQAKTRNFFLKFYIFLWAN